MAVLVVEGEQQPLGDFLVEPDELPEEDCHQDAVFEVIIEDCELQEALYEENATHERQEDAQSRFD